MHHINEQYCNEAISLSEEFERESGKLILERINDVMTHYKEIFPGFHMKGRFRGIPFDDCVYFSIMGYKFYITVDSILNCNEVPPLRPVNISNVRNFPLGLLISDKKTFGDFLRFIKRNSVDASESDSGNYRVVSDYIDSLYATFPKKGRLEKALSAHCNFT